MSIDLTVYGIYVSAGAIVCTDLDGLMKALDEDRVKMTMTNNVSRSKKSYQVLRLFTGTEEKTSTGALKSRKFYIAMPKGIRTAHFEDEHPKLIWKVGEGVEEEESVLNGFEALYARFLDNYVRPKIAGFYQRDDENREVYKDFKFVAAKISKAEEGGRGVPMNLPKDFSAAQRARLQEATGCHILMAIQYFYNIVDHEKATVVFGTNIEIGRFPFQVTVKAGGKRPRGSTASGSASTSDDAPEAKIAATTPIESE
jgi:hypothetical protein